MEKGKFKQENLLHSTNRTKYFLSQIHLEDRNTKH